MTDKNKDYIKMLLESAQNDDNSDLEKAELFKSEAEKAEEIRMWAEDWLDEIFEGFPLKREPLQ